MRHHLFHRFRDLLCEALPRGTVVRSLLDRRGRLLLSCHVEGIDSVRIIVQAEVMSSFQTSTAKQRAKARQHVETWLEERLAEARMCRQAMPPREWVLEPGGCSVSSSAKA